MTQGPTNADEARDLLRSTEAARIIGISVRTLDKYEEQGFITAFRTPSGHRRWRRAEVEALLSRDGAA
jgi:DNA-binding transcriptional MerR regulator